jgi:hypothetical protein
LKRDEGSGEGKNLFSREKKFFPSPEQSPLIGNSAQVIYCNRSFFATAIEKKQP